jgi:DNA-binding MurR/RpiR family transcriptional regulator
VETSPPAGESAAVESAAAGRATARVAAAVRRAMAAMTGTARRVARALLADYPTAGLSTVSALATAAGTSTASVVRFATRLGYQGFAALQRELREELSRSAGSPVSRATAGQTADAAAASAGTDPDGFQAAIEHRASLVRSAVRSVPDTEWTRFVDLLADDRHALLLAGGRLSHLAARYLQLQLRHVRGRTAFLADPLQADVGPVLDLRKGDVVVLFDFRRYGAAAASLAAVARQHNATLVLVTDVWLSPIARDADVVLPLHVDASFLDSLTAVFAVVEAAVPAVAARIGRRAIDRMAALEQVRVAAS